MTEITFVQQLCCSVLQRCWHDYTSVRRIKEAVLQMTAALAKYYFFIAFTSGNSDSRSKALHLSGGRFKENLSCRLHIANATAFFTHYCTPDYRDNLNSFSWRISAPVHGIYRKNKWQVRDYRKQSNPVELGCLNGQSLIIHHQCQLQEKLPNLGAEPGRTAISFSYILS